MTNIYPQGFIAPSETDPNATTFEEYIIRDGRLHPCIVVCPGGGYSHRAPHEGEPIALYLNSIGVSAVVLAYRIAPNRFPSSLEDLQRTVRYIRCHAAEYNLLDEKVGVLGFSAAGHLCATISSYYDNGNLVSEDPVERFSCRPDVAVLCYPVIDMSGCYKHQGSTDALLGENASPEICEKLSMHMAVHDGTVPAFIWHTENDGAVPVETSLLYCLALKQHSIPFGLHIYPDGPHGLGLAEDKPDVKEWRESLEKWLIKMNFLNK